MLNSLDAGKGRDFEYIDRKDIKIKLNPELIAFWEIVEGENMDIFQADGHPLGHTFKFRIDIKENKNYQEFFKNLQQEDLYSDYTITVEERIQGKEMVVTFEHHEDNGRLRKIKY